MFPEPAEKEEIQVKFWPRSYSALIPNVYFSLSPASPYPLSTLK